MTTEGFAEPRPRHLCALLVKNNCSTAGLERPPAASLLNMHLNLWDLWPYFAGTVEAGAEAKNRAQHLP